MSYQNGQRVPAWKRLGLKLKGPASGESPAPAAPASSANPTSTTSAPTQLQSTSGLANVGIKRKQPPSTSAPINRGLEKKQRTDAVVSSPKKTVKFTEDTKVSADKPTEASKKAPKKPKEKKKKTKPAAEAAETFSLEPSLAYLRQWHTDRQSWKFNKNHQTLVIKYFFDAARIPAADVPIFLAYIRDLKGFVRTRLREEAAEIKKKDMADGAGGFSQVKEKADKENKQELYEEILSKLLQLGQQEGEASATNGKDNGKRSFDETEFTAQEMDVDVKQRVVKRMRAELVLQELSESEESTTSADSGATTTTTASATQAETAEPVAEKRAKLNDGTQQVKRRRIRNSRTADISDDSSSESESDSDSDSDSSSSSSDDEEDEEMPLGNGQGAESSSSSSSSESESDSEDDSDAESESGGGAKVGQDGGDSSSESDDSDDE